MNFPKSTVSQLFDSIRGSERMRGIEVLFSSRALPLGGAAPRIAMVVGQSSYVPAEEPVDNWIDIVTPIQFVLWAPSGPSATIGFDGLREMRTRLLNCLYDFQFANDLLRVVPISDEIDDSPDTAQDGWEMTVSVTVRDTAEKVPLAADAGEATVGAEQFAPAAGTSGPTITISEE